MVVAVEAINYQMYNMVYTKMILLNLVKFEWDQGNYDKNWKRHQVMYFEAEEVFFDDNKKIFEDPHHSETEKRYILLGRTVTKRALFIVFTIRNNLVRVISARDLNKKEQKLLN